jgi:hypothetical protein
MAFLSGLVGCFILKLSKNLKTVAQTATNAEIGTASDISKSKKMSMIGILLPAPESPPALDKAMRININTVPIDSITGFLNGAFSSLISDNG